MKWMLMARKNVLYIRGLSMRNTMLIVDNTEEEQELLKQIFKKTYSVMRVKDGKEAMCYLETHLNEVVMLFLDICTPVMCGIEVMEYMKERGWINQVPVIIIADEKEQKVIEKGYALGAMDIISRPFANSVVKKRVYNIIELYKHMHHLEEEVRKQTKIVEQKIDKLKEHHNHLLNILRDIITNRNVESIKHIQYVQGYTRILANQYASLYPRSKMTKEKIEMIVQAAQMHDVGKITLPDSVTNRPGRLSQFEMELLKEHTIKGSEIMKVMSEMHEDDYSRICYNVCRYHHEKYDGTGYPEGMKRERIPVEAQIVGLADMYDALVNVTVNKEAFTPQEAFYKLMKGECGELSPRMKECLENARKSLEEFSI